MTGSLWCYSGILKFMGQGAQVLLVPTCLLGGTHLEGTWATDQMTVYPVQPS
jgi:hypothetical protein